MTRRMMLGGWRLFALVVVGNAAVQTATTLPIATPAASALFVALAALSALSLVASTTLIAAEAHSRAVGMPRRTPIALWAASTLAVVVIGVSGIALAPLVVLSIPAALIVVSGVAGGSPLAGLRSFARHPVRAIGLTLLTIASLVLLWVTALLLGFFWADARGAALTWVIFGVAGVTLLCAWTALTRRPSSTP